MISTEDINSPEKPLLEKNAIVGKLSLQKKLVQISENHPISAHPEFLTPVFKYQNKSAVPLGSSIKNTSPLHPGRFAHVPTARFEQTTVFELPALEEGEHCNTREVFDSHQLQNDCSDNFEFVGSCDSYHSLVAHSGSSRFDARNHSGSLLAVSNYPSPRVGLTGSLVTPARLKHRTDQLRKTMLSEHRSRAQKLEKSNETLSTSHSKVSPENNPPSFTAVPPYAAATTFQHQNWPKSVISKVERLRPNSAKNRLLAKSGNTKAANATGSLNSNTDPLLTSLRPSMSTSGLSNTLNKSYRPKSSSFRHNGASHIKVSRSCISVNPIATNYTSVEGASEKKTSNKLSENFTLTSQNTPIIHSARKVASSKKAKDFSLASSKLKSKSSEEKIHLNYRQRKTYGTSNPSVLADDVEHHKNASDKFFKHGSVDDLCDILKFGNSCNAESANGYCNNVSATVDDVGCDLKVDKNSHKSNKHITAVKAKSLKSAKSIKKFGISPSKSYSDIHAMEKVTKKVQDVSLSPAEAKFNKSMHQEQDVTGNLQNSMISYRKYSDDSGNGTLSAKSGRCCGDGADESLPGLQENSMSNLLDSKEWKSNRQPGDGEDENLLFVYDEEGFDYEDSLLEPNDGEGDQEEDCGDEMSCSQTSDAGTTAGEYLPCDDDDALDCIDSDVGMLDEDDAVSESAESESSALASYYKQQQDEEETVERKDALIKSIFSNCPPVINFTTRSELVEPLPQSFRKLLKWKMSTITPIVVRNTVMRSGFKASKKNHDWLGYFGKHMKSHGFRSLRDYQKINHFPGSFQLGRKDRLWRNISRMQTRFGKKEFGFVPQSFVLPWDKKLLKNAWDEGSSKQKYILKPPASARGIGIRVIHKWNQIPTKKPIMVQKYLARPYLINGNKFDLRLYVHVTSFDPLRIYLFEDGLVRFATCKYSNSMKHLSNRYMHLTNYSINKKSGDFEQNDNASICQGHKWSLKALWGYLQQNGINTEKIWEQMKDIVVKTIISVEQYTNSLVKSNCRRRYCCHELFGFDIMLDDKLRPWLLEVNISPSLHSNSPLDVEIKGPMVKDMFNLCGFLLPDKKAISANAPSTNSSVPCAAASFSQEKRKQSNEVSPDTKLKHTYFAQHYKLMDEQSIQTFLLETLTVNDIRILVESEGEASRSGGFQRIFPSTNRKYLRYFEQPRYYNELLHAWGAKYHSQGPRAESILESYCRKGLHLPHYASDPSIVPADHVWSAAAISQPKILPSPRTDIRMPPVVAKPPPASMPTPHSPTIITSALSSTLSRNRSAKTRKNFPGMYGDSPTAITAKHITSASSREQDA